MSEIFLEIKAGNHIRFTRAATSAVRGVEAMKAVEKRISPIDFWIIWIFFNGQTRQNRATRSFSLPTKIEHISKVINIPFLKGAVSHLSCLVSIPQLTTLLTSSAIQHHNSFKWEDARQNYGLCL